MRYLVGFVVALALGVMACETSGTGGSDHVDGGTSGEGGYGGDGGAGGIGGGGVGGDGGAGGIPECETAEDCDDKNECTTDACDPLDGSCENTPAPDGSDCGGDNYGGNPRGGCYEGICNFVPVSVTFAERESVFDWTTERCEDLDLPDQPARFVRAADGQIVVFDSNAPTYYVSRGADFDSFVRVCDPPALVSADLQTPESYQNWEWIWVVYREGLSWHALVHNEFHDAVAPTCKVGDPSPANPCWYNSITHAVSTDGARSFVKPGAPAHTVAPAPRVWIPPPPDAPPQRWYAEGYFGPSNIVRGPDDYYYALFRSIPGWAPDPGGACVMRTKSLGEPMSWRAWDGTDFTLAMESPYVTGSTAPFCVALETTGGDALMHDVTSLTYNTYLDRYMAVGQWGQGVDAQTFICGFYFSLSSDLIHWSDVQLLARADFGVDWDCYTGPGEPPLLEPVQTTSPSIVDHLDSTTNFERPGRTPYLYYTRHNPTYWLDRDLVRVPLTFTLEE